MALVQTNVMFSSVINVERFSLIDGTACGDGNISSVKILIHIRSTIRRY